VFGELYGSAVETRIARDFMEVPVWLKGGPEPSTVSETLFRADRLKTMRMRLSAAYKGVNALLMKEGAQDFRSGQKFDHTVFFGENVDIHHVFPQDWCKKHGIKPSVFDSIINSIGNEQRRGISRSAYAEDGVVFCESLESVDTDEFPALRNCAVGQSTQRRSSGWILTPLCNSHGYACDPADDGDVTGIADTPSMSTGMRRGNQYQLAPIEFAPTADVAIAEFEEEDRAVEVVMPIYGWDRPLPGIDLDEGTGANNGVESAVLHSNVAVKGIAPIDLLQERGRNIFPILEYFGQKIGSFGPQSVAEFAG
jgi:hypothetical protein